MKNDYTRYAASRNANEHVVYWLEHNLVNYLKNHDEVSDEIEHIMDYLMSDEAPVNMSAMSYAEAHRNAEKWTKKMIKKGQHIKESDSDTKVILDFKDGFKIVQLVGRAAYEREGYLMHHCVGGYADSGKEIYSLRDADNMPHCTMERDQQIKGKGNGDIHPKYIDYVVRFLEHMDMKVRDSEMEHLGYEVVVFAKYCTSSMYRNRYVRKGQDVTYSDKVAIYTDFYRAQHHKGVEICLYKGNVEITEDITLGKIQGISGYLYIYSNATLPSLKTIGGDVFINSNTTLPSLKTIGDYVFIDSNATLEAESLKTIGGYLYINSKSCLNKLQTEQDIRAAIKVVGEIEIRI